MEEEQGVQAQKPHATSQVEDSNPSVFISAQAQEVKQVQKSTKESSLPFGNDPILIEIDSPTTLMMQFVI